MTTTVAGPSQASADAASEPGWSRPAWGMDESFGPILAGALDAFSEMGSHGATVRDIASRVGVTGPQIYYHHSSQEGLLSELLRTVLPPSSAVCNLLSDRSACKED